MRKQIGQMLVLLCLCFPVAHLHAAPLVVTVLLSESSGPYQEFAEALQEKLIKKNVYLDIVDDPSEVIWERSLVIAAGMKAAAAAAASKAPAILNVLIPESGHQKLLREHPQRASSKAYSAIHLDQPFERQIRLIEALLPGGRQGNPRQVGVLYDSFPAGELSEFRHKLARHRMGLYERKVDGSLPLYKALQEVLDNSDVLLALPDASIYNNSTIRNILLASYRSRDPVIGFSPGYVKAGALAAVYSTPAQIAGQAAQAIRQYGETRTLPPVQHPQLFEVAVNEQVGRSLGLAAREAKELRDEIGAIAGDEP
jgi:hypothetical protein